MRFAPQGPFLFWKRRGSVYVERTEERECEMGEQDLTSVREKREPFLRQDKRDVSYERLRVERGAKGQETMR